MRAGRAVAIVGWLLGSRRLVWAIPAAAALGLVCLAECYTAAFDIDQPGQPIDDNAVGAGLVIYGVPAVALLLGLLAAGFGINGATALLRARST